MGGAQASRLSVLGPEAKGSKGQERVSWQWARPPLEIWACFLIPSFLCGPDQAAKRGRGSSGWDQGGRAVQILMKQSFLWVSIPCARPLMGIILSKPPPLPERKACSPHFTEVETKVQRGLQATLLLSGSWWGTQVLTPERGSHWV